jgi:phosphoribosylaminoimidazole-succinocarboxamide synthase
MMIVPEALKCHHLMTTLPSPFMHSDLPALGARHSGKVRDWYNLSEGRRALIVTDRISAFDRILGAIPYKGQVLNQLAAFWFGHTLDIVPNHLLRMPDPNVSIVKTCKPWPVEIVVRGYITGVTSTSLWTLYAQGERDIYGITLPDGLRKNDRLPAPIITPTTKAEHGAHDERITRDEIVARGLVPAQVYAQIERVALALFQRGSEICAAGGLTLVDTKYEFGDHDGELTLIDEIHTPDSSRFWLNSHPTLPRSAGEGKGGGEPVNFDKEFIRLWYAERGYKGEGEPPAMSDDLIEQASARYIAAFEMIAGETFTRGEYPVNERIARSLQSW